ncbi:MAG: InlB B-repeat-containing protein, partial [Phascolarctobacterium sp.]|nr:InlB B-repeat-containing protein [Phascolarctobacterium sp.]
MTSLDPDLDTSEWSYVYSNDGTTATLIIPRDSIKADITIVIATNIISHTVYFDPNSGSCETTEKEIIEGSSNYGELPTPTRPGYDFDGWYTDPIGGDKVTEDTPYDKTEDSTLYAHWVPDGKTPYKIQHWIELAESDNGVNVGYVAGTTETYTDADSGVTYYLYQTDSYSNGIADATMDITGLVLSEMSSEDYDWWTIDGFTFNTDISDMSVYVNADGTSVYNMYYDRNVYKVTLDDGDGDPDNDPEIDVKYGDEIGNEDLITPEDEDKTPQNPGYEFEYWEDEDGNPVDPTDPYTKTEDDTYTPHWKEKEDTVYVVHYMLQDITQDEETGRFSVVEGSYSDVSSAESYDELYGGMSVREYYFAEDGSVVACYAGIGKTNSSVTLETIPAITGFNYVGFATSLETSGDADAEVTLTISGNDADIDAITDVDAISANGTITEVFLYYDRVVNKVHIDDGSDDPDYDPDDDPEVPYGGDFEDVIPDPDDPDVPTKPGYDYDGVENGDGAPVDPTDPTDPYTEEDGDIEFDVIWTPRVYETTYVIDADSSFVAGEGGTASKVPTVQYGYRDGRTVTYDEQMGDMPTATKSGYTFVGWFIDPDDMSTMVTSSTYVTIDTVIIENETNEYEDTRPLYAVWTPNAYIVSFESGTSLKGVDASECAPITVYMGQEYGKLYPRKWTQEFVYESTRA